MGCIECQGGDVKLVRKKLNFVKQFKGVTIEYGDDGGIRVSINFKEPLDSNCVWLDITKNNVAIYKTLRDGGEIIKEFDQW